jgi:hypothetical protein
MRSYQYQDHQNYPAEPRRKNPMIRVFRTFSLLATGGVALAGLFVGFGIWRTGDRFLSSLTAMFTTPQPEPQADVRSIVLHQIRGASELTTAVFAMQAVVPASRDRTLGGYTIGKTTLLYIAYGEVRAGVNLADLQPENIQLIGNTVTIQLPPPEILDSKIDVNRSSVYDYDRGFLGLGPDSAPELQSLAQRETLKQIVQTACNQGLLQEANERAEFAITQLLNTAGYKEFLIDIQSPSPDSCTAPLEDSNPSVPLSPVIPETLPSPSDKEPLSN